MTTSGEPFETRPDTNAEAANTQIDDNQVDSDRRKFLASCGRFAAVTPPAITLLLSTSLNSDAIAKSSGGGGGGGSKPKHHHRDFDLDKWLYWWWKRLF